MLNRFLLLAAICLASQISARADRVNWVETPVFHVAKRLEPLVGKTIILKDPEISKRVISLRTPGDRTATEVVEIAKAALLFAGVQWQEGEKQIELSAFLTVEEAKALKRSIFHSAPRPSEQPKTKPKTKRRSIVLPPRTNPPKEDGKNPASSSRRNRSSSPANITACRFEPISPPRAAIKQSARETDSAGDQPLANEVDHAAPFALPPPPRRPRIQASKIPPTPARFI